MGRILKFTPREGNDSLFNQRFEGGLEFFVSNYGRLLPETTDETNLRESFNEYSYAVGNNRFVMGRHFLGYLHAGLYVSKGDVLRAFETFEENSTFPGDAEKRAEEYLGGAFLYLSNASDIDYFNEVFGGAFKEFFGREMKLKNLNTPPNRDAVKSNLISLVEEESS